MYRFGLVGCGRVAKRYAELLGGGEIDGAVLAAVCDVDDSKARAMGERYDLPWYGDMHEMMQQEPSLDVVVVLTESGRHARHCVELTKYRKHIVVEKPMALTPSDADAMIAACDAAGIRLFVVKQNRFNLPVVKLREALESGRLGRLVMGSVRVFWSRDQAYYDQESWRGTWAMDGGVFANQAVHHLDLLIWMLGDPISVFATSQRALVDIEAEDTGAAIIQFAGGAIGVVEATTAVRPSNLEASLTIIGEGGSVEIGGTAVNRMRTWQFADGLDDEAEIKQKYGENPPDVYGFGHRRYLQHVVNAISNDAPALVDGLEGRRSLETLSAIYESVETGAPVTIRYQPKHCRLGLPSLLA